MSEEKEQTVRQKRRRGIVSGFVVIVVLDQKMVVIGRPELT